MPGAPAPAPDGAEAGRRAAKENLDLDSPISLLAQRLREAGSSLTEVKGPADLARRLAGEVEPLWLEDHPWLHPVAGELEKLGVKHRVAQTDWAPEAGTAVTVGLGAIPETGSVLVDSGGGPGAVLAFRAEKTDRLDSPAEFPPESGPGPGICPRPGTGPGELAHRPQPDRGHRKSAGPGRPGAS